MVKVRSFFVLVLLLFLSFAVFQFQTHFVQAVEPTVIPEFVTQWGTQGSENSQFSYPSDVVIDHSGNVNVADSGNGRIQKFNSGGEYISQWGVSGNEDNQLYWPTGLAVDSQGYFYILEASQKKVKKFNSTGEHITTWGSAGTEEGQFGSYPHGISVDSADNVYVADCGNKRVQKFNSSGGFILAFGTSGLGDGQFNCPYGIANDEDNNIYVTDYGNNRVQKFNSNGVYISQWGSNGNGNGNFLSPKDIAVDSNGYVYVVDYDAQNVQKFDSSGSYLGYLSYAEFNYPEFLGVDNTGNVYVSNGENHNILFFAYPEEASPTIELSPLAPDPGSSSTPTFSGSVSDESGVSTVQFQIDGTAGEWSSCEFDTPSLFYTESFGGESFPPTDWVTGGNVGWSSDNTIGWGDSDSVASGVIANSQTSWLSKSITFESEAWLSFDWKVSSESAYDHLLFCLDNDNCTRTDGYNYRISGEADWAKKRLALSAGTHSLKWMYAKDSGGLSGSDRGWIDNISINPITDTYTCSISTPLSDGEHTIYVRATDLRGSTTQSEGYVTDTFTVGFPVTPTPSIDPDSSIYVIIDAELATREVESNIGELPDPAAATNLYFERSGFGRIEFASTLDLTDAAVITWLQDLGNKLDLSTLNKIGLDADLVQELIDTQATLTMYNVTLNNPKILVDGAEDLEGVVTNLSYDQEADTLTFTAAHFTEFTAVEQTTQNTGSQPPSTTKPLTCGNETPVGSPDLFEIRSTNTATTLFFAPAGNPVNKYYIAYSTNGMPYQHGVEFTPPYNDGVISYTINHLNPNTPYFFTVRAGNGCAPGNWSQTMEVTTTKNLLQKKSWYWYK